MELFSNLKNSKSYKYVVYAILFFTWMGIHANRTCWAYIHRQIHLDLGYSDYVLGVINMTFLFTYSFGLFFSGSLADRVDRPLLYSIGLLITTICFTIVGINGATNFSTPGLIVIIFGVMGIAQSIGWPVSIALTQSWFANDPHRYLFMAGFGINGSLGNILGEQIAAIFGGEEVETWQNPVFIVSGITFLSMLLMYFLVKQPPQTFEPSINAGQNQVESKAEYHAHTSQTKETISIIEGFKVPGVLSIAVVFLFVKAVSYGMMYWLPDFLQTVAKVEHSVASYLLFWEIGSGIGSLSGGYLAARFKSSSLVMITSLIFGSIIFLMIFILQTAAGTVVFFTLMFMGGFCVGIPFTLIPTVVSADLGADYELFSKREVLGTVTGVIDGCGSVGAALFQVVIPALKKFIFLIETMFLVLSIMLLLPTVAHQRLRKSVVPLPKDVNEFPKEIELKTDTTMDTSTAAVAMS